MHGYRVTFLTGLATGYVLGARAGRERYEQIKKLSRATAEHPAVQQAAGALQAQAAGAANTAKSKISDGLQQRAAGARQKVTDRLPGRRGSGTDSPKDGSRPFAAANGHADRSGIH